MNRWANDGATQHVTEQPRVPVALQPHFLSGAIDALDVGPTSFGFRAREYEHDLVAKAVLRPFRSRQQLLLCRRFAGLPQGPVVREWRRSEFVALTVAEFGLAKLGVLSSVNIHVLDGLGEYAQQHQEPARCDEDRGRTR